MLEFAVDNKNTQCSHLMHHQEAMCAHGWASKACNASVGRLRHTGCSYCQSRVLRLHGCRATASTSGLPDVSGVSIVKAHGAYLCGSLLGRQTKRFFLRSKAGRTKSCVNGHSRSHAAVRFPCVNKLPFAHHAQNEHVNDREEAKKLTLQDG